MAKIRLIVKVSDIVYMGEKDIDQEERKTELEKDTQELLYSYQEIWYYNVCWNLQAKG